MKNRPWNFKASGRGELTIELFDQIGEDLFSERTACLSDVRIAFDQLHAYARFAESD